MEKEGLTVQYQIRFLRLAVFHQLSHHIGFSKFGLRK